MAEPIQMELWPEPGEASAGCHYTDIARDLAHRWMAGERGICYFFDARTGAPYTLTEAIAHSRDSQISCPECLLRHALGESPIHTYTPEIWRAERRTMAELELALATGMAILTELIQQGDWWDDEQIRRRRRQERTAKARKGKELDGWQ